LHCAPRFESVVTYFFKALQRRKPAFQSAHEPWGLQGENPHINAARVKELLNVTDPTARAALGELESAGLIHETTGRSWGGQCLARGVLKAIEMPQGGDED
jgi:Fic family protein